MKTQPPKLEKRIIELRAKLAGVTREAFNSLPPAEQLALMNATVELSALEGRDPRTVPAFTRGSE